MRKLRTPDSDVHPIHLFSYIPLYFSVKVAHPPCLWWGSPLGCDEKSGVSKDARLRGKPGPNTLKGGAAHAGCPTHSRSLRMSGPLRMTGRLAAFPSPKVAAGRALISNGRS